MKATGDAASMPGAWRRFCCSLASPWHSPRGRREVGGKEPSSLSGIAVALLVLWGAAWCLAAAARRWAPSRWPYVWRQGLANLQRPSNQTTTVVLAIGFGAFLLGTLLLVQANLLRTLRITGGPARPNLVMFDIQPDQRPAVDEMLSSAGFKASAPVPIVPMRIQSVKGRPVAAMLADTVGSGGDESRSGWSFRHEYRSTYRDTLVSSERSSRANGGPGGLLPARFRSKTASRASWALE